VAPTLLGPLERASQGPVIEAKATQQCRETPSFLPEDGNRSSFRNVVFLSKHWTMDKVQKPDSFKFSRAVCVAPHTTAMQCVLSHLHIITMSFVIAHTVAYWVFPEHIFDRTRMELEFEAT
jgi:hypothetical protein